MNRTILIGMLLLVGCGPQMIIKTGDGANKYAPSNEVKGGTIEYRTARSSDRDTAYKQMHDYCNGPYKIAQERTVTKDGMGTTSPVYGTNASATIYGGEEFRQIDFQCED